MLLASLLIACAPEPPPAPAAPPPAAEAPAPAEEAPAAEPVVRNRPPRIGTVVLSPAAPRRADNVVVTVDATDPDGDPVDLDFTWYVDDVVVPGAGGETLFGRFEKGNRVRVEVVASDGTAEVKGASEPVTIGNTNPTMETGARDVTRVDGFRFRASDPDGDTLAWRLEGAPPGMTISPEGVLSYQGSEDEPGGQYRIAVLADDGEGWARFELPLRVEPGSKAVAAAKEGATKAAAPAGR